VAVDPKLLALIDEAREAGLKLELEGASFAVSGPKAAKPVALRVIDRRPEILALLRTGYAQPWPELLPDFSRRRVVDYALCAGGPGNVECSNERWTYVRYGDRPTCLPCARSAIEQAVVVTTIRPPSSKVPA
jgi:hypothetical protein